MTKQHRRIYPLLVLTLLILAGLACSPSQTELGIICLALDADGVIAVRGYDYGGEDLVYHSDDGGTTWGLIPTEYEEGVILREKYCPSVKTNWTLESGGETFLIQRDEISKQTDNGWEIVISDLLLPDQHRVLYARDYPTFYLREGGAEEAIVYEDTIIVAMGLEGVLIHPPKGEWTYTPVREYHHASITFGTGVDLLKTELLLGIALFFLSIGTLRLFGRHEPLPAALAITAGVAWLIWLVSILGKPIFTVYIAYPSISLILTGLMIISLIAFGVSYVRSPATTFDMRRIPIIMAGSLTVFMFSLYFGWMLFDIPGEYDIAMILTLFCVGTGIIGAGSKLHQMHPSRVRIVRPFDKYKDSRIFKHLGLNRTSLGWKTVPLFLAPIILHIPIQFVANALSFRPLGIIYGAMAGLVILGNVLAAGIIAVLTTANEQNSEAHQLLKMSNIPPEEILDGYLAQTIRVLQPIRIVTAGLVVSGVIINAIAAQDVFILLLFPIIGAVFFYLNMGSRMLMMMGVWAAMRFDEMTSAVGAVIVVGVVLVGVSIGVLAVGFLLAPIYTILIGYYFILLVALPKIRSNMEEDILKDLSV